MEKLIVLSEKQAARFWAKMERFGPCLRWCRYIDQGTGYGIVVVNGQMLLAHRVAYTLYHGPIPKGLKVLHSCDRKWCVAEEHLFLGTQTDNVADYNSKGRMRALLVIE